MRSIITCLLLQCFSVFSFAQNVGIGTTTPNASAVLDASSTTKGFLPPRLTIAQRNAIISPASGLTIFCSDCDELEVFNGFVWKNMSGTAGCVSTSLPFIKICDQIWMPNNLNVSKYRNGDNIPQVTDQAVWSSLTIGAWCWFNNDSATYAATFGKLYNWYAINDPRGLAPQGWHVASDAEWATLSTCSGGDAVAGSKLKEAGTTHWSSPNAGATNSSGFTALPGGYRDFGGYFAYVNYDGNFWSSTEYNVTTAWGRYLYYNNISLDMNNFNKTSGFSVRCVKD